MWRTVGKVFLWLAGIAVAGLVLLIFWPLSTETQWIIAGAVVIGVFNWNWSQHLERERQKHEELVRRLAHVESLLTEISRQIPFDPFKR